MVIVPIVYQLLFLLYVMVTVLIVYHSYYPIVYHGYYPIIYHGYCSHHISWLLFPLHIMVTVPIVYHGYCSHCMSWLLFPLYIMVTVPFAYHGYCSHCISWLLFPLHIISICSYISDATNPTNQCILIRLAGELSNVLLSIQIVALLHLCSISRFKGKYGTI